MQVIGTYDVSLRRFMPGLDLGPDYISRRERHADDFHAYVSRANVFEVAFDELPDNVFALVPIVLDESNVSRKELIKEAIVKCKQFQDFSFRLDVFCRAQPPAQHKDHLEAMFENEVELAERKTDMWDTPEADVIEVCDGDKRAGGEVMASAFRGSRGAAKKKKFKATAKRAPTAAEEEAWMRQSWSLPTTSAQAAAASAAAATAATVTAAAATADIPSLSKSMKTGTAVDAASPAAPPSPSFASTPGGGGPARRWVQLELSQRVGRLLPQQLRDLYNALPAGEPDAVAAPVPALDPRRATNMSLLGGVGGGKGRRKYASTSASDDVEAWQRLDGVFGVADAYVPFVVFRRAAASGGWAVKKLLHRVCRSSAQLDLVIREVMVRLARSRVLPYHIMHVEHCSNCETHQATTRHVPGSYEEAFVEFRTTFKQTLPPMLIFSNNRAVCPAPFRVGSFEVLMRPYASTVTRFVYSKLQSNRFPDNVALAVDMNPLYLPPVKAFRDASSAMLEVVAFDSCTRKLVAYAEVSVYRVGVTVLSTRENLEGAADGVTDTPMVVEHQPARRRGRDKTRAEGEGSDVVGPGGRRSPSPEERDRLMEHAAGRVFFSNMPLDRRRYTLRRPHTAGGHGDGDDDDDEVRDWSPTHVRPAIVERSPPKGRTFMGTQPLPVLLPYESLKMRTLRMQSTAAAEAAAEAKRGGEGPTDGDGKDAEGADAPPAPAPATPGPSAMKKHGGKTPAGRSTAKRSRFADTNTDDDDNDNDAGTEEESRGRRRPRSVGRARPSSASSAGRPPARGASVDAFALTRKPSRAAAAASRPASYANVCTWTKNDVVTWFRVYGASDDVVENAMLAGVVDGPSFSELVTLQALQKWGVRSRKTLKRLGDGLNYVTYSGVQAEGGGATLTLGGTALAFGGGGGGGGEVEDVPRPGPGPGRRGDGALVGHGTASAEAFLRRDAGSGRVRRSIWGDGAHCVGHAGRVPDDGVDFADDLDPDVRLAQARLPAWRRGEEVDPDPAGAPSPTHPGPSVSPCARTHPHPLLLAPCSLLLVPCQRPPLSPTAPPHLAPSAGVDYHLVARGFTSTAGLYRARIPLSGRSVKTP